MSTNALHRKMMAEFLEKIKDWPEDALRSVKDAIEGMLVKQPSGKKHGKRKGTMDAFGAWVGPESAEEIIGMIHSARTSGPEREPLD